MRRLIRWLILWPVFFCIGVAALILEGGILQILNANFWHGLDELSQIVTGELKE